MKLFTPRSVAAATLGFIIAFAPGAARAAESLSLLLQKAIFVEETEGNLDSAIKLYEQIAAESAANRALAAQAQYRLAVCYQKQGRKDVAVRILRDLVHGVAAPALMNQVRRSLAELGQETSEAVALRPVAMPLDAWGIWRVSSDARHVVYTPQANSRLVVFDTQTGKCSALSYSAADDESWAWASFSPDNRWIAYDVKGAEIRVSKVDGTDSRAIVKKAEEKEWFEPIDWSHDGKRVILGSWIKGRAHNYAVAVAVDTGERTVMATIAADSASWCLSVDNRHLAFRKGAAPGALILMDLTGRRSDITVNAEIERVVGWAMDDTRILYTKKRAASLDLWATTIKDGKVSGEPELIWANWGDVFAIGFAEGGRVFYRTRATRNERSTLWEMSGFLTRKVASYNRPTGNLPFTEITGPNNTIYDPKSGASLLLPSGWRVKDANRRDNGNVILHFDGGVLAVIGFGCWFETPVPAPPRPANASELDGWLRRIGEVTSERKGTTTSYPGYRQRSASITSGKVGGRPSVSWWADFEKPEQRKWAEFVTLIAGEKTTAMVYFNAPLDNVEVVRPAFEALVQSVRVP